MQCWHTPLIPALGRQRLADLCEFEATEVYRASSRTAGAVTKRNRFLENKEKRTGLEAHTSIPVQRSLRHKYCCRFKAILGYLDREFQPSLS